MRNEKRGMNKEKRAMNKDRKALLTLLSVICYLTFVSSVSFVRDFFERKGKAMRKEWRIRKYSASEGRARKG